MPLPSSSKTMENGQAALAERVTSWFEPNDSISINDRQSNSHEIDKEQRDRSDVLLDEQRKTVPSNPLRWKRLLKLFLLLFLVVGSVIIIRQQQSMPYQHSSG